MRLGVGLFTFRKFGEQMLLHMQQAIYKKPKPVGGLFAWAVLKSSWVLLQGSGYCIAGLFVGTTMPSILFDVCQAHFMQTFELVYGDGNDSKIFRNGI